MTRFYFDNFHVLLHDTELKLISVSILKVTVLYLAIC